MPDKPPPQNASNIGPNDIVVVDDFNKIAMSKEDFLDKFRLVRVI